MGDQQHWGGMGLNVQSGHSKVGAGPRVCYIRPSYAGGASLPGRSAHSVLSFSFVSLCLLRLSFLSSFFHGSRAGGVSGATGTSDSSQPFRHPHVLAWIAGGGVGGQAWICTLSSLSFTMDWGGRRAEREGGLSAGCALPGPIHHRFLRLWSPHFLLPKAWPSLVEAALGAGFCPDYVYFPLHPAFLLSSSLSPFLLSSPFFFLPPVSLFSLLSRVLVSRNVGKGPAVQPRDQASHGM